MAVISSTATFDGPVQADGRRQVIERHQFTGGEIATYTYFAMPDDDIQSVATARAVSLLEAAADAETLANVERDGPFTLNHQTGAQFAARFREMVRSAFGMTAGQWTTFKSNKVTPRANAWAAVIAATGE